MQPEYRGEDVVFHVDTFPTEMKPLVLHSNIKPGIAPGVCQSEPFSKTLRVQYGEHGVGRRKSGPIAYRATSRPLA